MTTPRKPPNTMTWQKPGHARTMQDMALSREEFGRRMRAARERANLTQQEVADQLGIPWRAAQRWDTGKVMPRANRIPQLAEILGVDVAYLQEPVDENVIDRTARIVQENAVALRTASALLDELLREVRANGHAIVTATSEVNGRLEALEARVEAPEFTDAQREVLRLAGVQIPPPAEAEPGSSTEREAK